MIDSNKHFWEKIYRQNIGKMIGIGYRYTADNQTAEDLAHDAFIIAYEKSATFEGKGPFEAWLRRIVVNVALQFLREKKKKTYLDEWIAYEKITMETQEVNHTKNEHYFTEEELLEAINQLPEHHKLVFNMYVIDHFSHIQIAQELGISDGTSKSHLARARKKIRLILAEKMEMKEEEKDSKYSFLLFFTLPFKLWNVDKFYKNQFYNFEILPQKHFSIDSLDFSKVPISNAAPTVTILSGFVKVCISMALIVPTVYFVLNILKSKPEANLFYQNKFDTKSGVLNDSILAENVILTEKLENFSKTDSTTATDLNNNIMLSENLNKNENMKNSKAIGTLLIAGSSLALPSFSQQKESELTTLSTNYQLVLNRNLQLNKSVVLENNLKLNRNLELKNNHNLPTNKSLELNENKNFLLSNKNVGSEWIKNDNSKDASGTFYATKLHWSETNHELYFKGKVVVSIEGNNFVGDGDFTFIGKVYHLVVDGISMKLDNTIKLTEKKYNLKKLSAKNAEKKYGEIGKMGAVEISLAE
ncbi:MAG: sigma-70 family RNA polymerase sigma factor [Bacteroidota bacterium]